MKLGHLTWISLLVLCCLPPLMEAQRGRGARIGRARGRQNRNGAGNANNNRAASNANNNPGGQASNGRTLQDRFKIMFERRKLKREQKEKRQLEQQRLLEAQQAKELAEKQARAVQKLAEQQRLEQIANDAKIQELRALEQQKLAEQKALAEQTQLLADQKALEEKRIAEQNRIAAEQKALQEQAGSNQGLPLPLIPGDPLGPVDTGAWSPMQGEPLGGAILGPAVGELVQQNQGVLLGSPDVRQETLGPLGNPEILMPPIGQVNPGGQFGQPINPGEPLGTSINPGEPLGTLMNPGEPLGTFINPGEQIGTLANPGEPLGTLMNQGEPLGTSINPGEPLGTFIHPGEPLGTSINQGEPIGTLANPGEPLGTQGTPMGGIPLGSAGPEQSLGAAVFQDVNLNDILSPSELGAINGDSNGTGASPGNRIVTSKGIQTVGGGFIPLAQSAPTKKPSTTTSAPDSNARNRNMLFSLLSGINI